MSDDIDEVEFTSDLEPYDSSKQYEVAEAHDDTDVQACLDSDTQDGKGATKVPKASFLSYASDDEGEI